MKFGQRKADAPPPANSDGKYLRNFKPGDTLVRFLEEPQDWTEFFEHYTTDNKGFPCTRERATCPGCTSDIEKVRRASRKYATNILLVKNKQVLPFRVPVSVADKMETRYERNENTITSRDYVIIKTGSGLDTEYDVDTEDKYSVDLPALRKEAMDIEDILQASYAEVWGGDAPAPRESKSEDEGELSLTVEQVKAMSKPELIDLATKAGLEIDADNDTKNEILEKLLAAFGES